MTLSPNRLRWFRNPTLGMLSLAAFVVCAASGVMLAPAFQAASPLDSLSLLLLKNPAGAYIRSFHYWSAQAFFGLTLAHMVEYLLRRAETRTNFGVWVRLGLAAPVIVGAMLTGFLLRGDSAAVQALPILRSLLGLVPVAGAALSRVLAGSDASLSTIYIHHVCTATLLIWLVTAEHARRLFPNARAVAWTLITLVPLSLVMVPAIEWRSVGVEIGPWYLAGLQEFLHWLPKPGIAVWLGGALLAVLILLPRFPAPIRGRLKLGLAAAALLYAGLTVVALGFRGEGWQWTTPALPAAADPAFLSYRLLLPVEASLVAAAVPMIAGRREGCLACHAAMTGFAPAHSPERIGCSSCHEGNPLTLNPTLAHTGMTLTPGNLSLANRTCASSQCHLNVALRVQSSPMNTMSGVIAVDKFVFGEAKNPDLHYNVAALGHTAADTHLRTLCASCHLGQDKPVPATVDELSRGGGCSACHLSYDAAAAAELHNRPFSRAPLHHPEISIQIGEQSCFGCHSRSGRIATNYEGWHETLLEQIPARAEAGRYRVLADGRVFEKQAPDVHFEQGMACVDCHVAAEVMGTATTESTAPTHAAEAVKIACVDCHPKQSFTMREFSSLDAEAQTIAALRKVNVPGRRFLASPSAVYTNVHSDSGSAPALELKGSARMLPLKPVSAACARAQAMHPRMECRTCHTAWAPQCVTCHTTYDRAETAFDYIDGKERKGAWQEQGGDFVAAPPVLGVARLSGAGERVVPFAPGMILALDLPRKTAGVRSDLHRYFAAVSPHTTSAKSRSCVSCHADPAALGYGSGRLEYVVRNGSAEWRFTPAFPLAPDGLPRDAWIRFLQEPSPDAAALGAGRPFTLEEQRRILLVGACLQCHKESETRVANVFTHFVDYRAKLSRKCILPEWAASQGEVTIHAH